MRRRLGRAVFVSGLVERAQVAPILGTQAFVGIVPRVIMGRSRRMNIREMADCRLSGRKRDDSMN